MPTELVLLDGSTFFCSEANGDLRHDGAQGYFHQDVRHLSRWSLVVDGAPLHAVTSTRVDYYSARIVSVPASTLDSAHSPISVRRDRFVAGGVHEDIVVENHGLERRPVRVELRFGCDFADIAEAQGRSFATKARRRTERSDRSVAIWYRRDGYVRGTRIAVGEPCEIARDRILFQLELDPKERWSTCVDVSAIVQDDEQPPLLACDQFGQPLEDMPIDFEQWMAGAPVLDADWDDVERAYRQSLADLASLRLRPTDGLTHALPAGGLPWFMTLFGRDSIIAAYQALPFRPELAHTALEALAELQAVEDDAFCDAEPGKIIHELRRGERAFFGELPGRYYGTHDATPLFLILLDEYERWTGDLEHVRSLETAARRALEWIEGPGDRDGDGYLEYERRSTEGLDNQCWKDSFDSIRFADGRFAAPPIATCEIQGYAYDARLRAARLARGVWGDETLAERLEADAHGLKERFNRDFWIEERRHYALALDGRKRRVDALTSNTGHLLWSGIVDDERAATVVGRLLSQELWTGWGIRTMSTGDIPYGPLEYHNGGVWPHDTAIVAEGMRRYGFVEEAATIARAFLEAASAFAFRPPELFAGFARDPAGVPVEYPNANRPQAFATGAALMAIRTLLGLDVQDDRLAFHVSAPAGVGRMRLSRLAVRGGYQEIVAA